MKQKFFSNLILVLVLNVIIKPIYILGIDAEVLKITELNNPGSYGTYFSLLNLTFIFNILLDIGINNFNTKNIAQNNQLFQKHFSKIFTLKLSLSFLYLFVLVIAGYLFDFSYKEMKWLILIGFNQVLVAIILYLRSNLSALFLFKRDGILSVVDRLILILFCGYFLWAKSNHELITIDFFIYSQTFAYMSTIIVGLVFLLKYSSIPKLHWDRLFFNLIIKKSFPYALLVFLMSIYYYSDVIMVEQITNNIEAVNYAHGYRFFLAFNMLGYLFAGLLLPIFSKLIKDKDNVVPVSWLSFKLIFLLSAIIGVSIWIYKSDILSWRYGIVNYELDHSSETFGWLMVSFIAVSCNYIFGTLLTANENLKSLNILAIFGIIINISLNLILIPKSGSVGAAFASACTQFFVLIIQIFLCFRYFEFKFHLKSTLQITSAIITFLLGAISLSIYSNLEWQYNFIFTLMLGFLIGLIHNIFNRKELFHLLKTSKS